MRALPDRDPGAGKAACPDDRRLVGLSHSGDRGLCSDAGARGLRPPGGTHEVVRDERHVETGRDRASGYTKLQCPPRYFLTGYSVRGAAVSAALCVGGRALGTAGRTVWFDRSDDRPPAAGGGDFAHGHHKGQCTTDEYAAGIACTGRLGSSRTPDALLCRPLR